MLELTKDIINTSDDLIFVKDINLRTIYCNVAFAKAIGKEPEELYGRTDIENGWSPELVKGDPEKGIRGFEADDREVLSGKTIQINSEPANIKNEIRYFNTIKNPLIDENDKVIGVVGIARDITERKQEEEEFHKLSCAIERHAALDMVNIIGFGVILIDSNRNILCSNKIANKICMDNEECFDTETLFYCRNRDIESWLTKNVEEIIKNRYEDNINSSLRTIMVKRASLNMPLLLMISSYHNELMSVDSDGVGDPLAIIFLSDPTRDINVTTELYEELYGLSSSEAKVVHYIVNGMKVNYLAEHLCVTVATVRKHLHNIFNKTQTTNQADLVRLVMSSSAWFNTSISADPTSE